MFWRNFTVLCVLGAAPFSFGNENPTSNDAIEMSVEAREYLEEVFSILKNNSLFRDKTNWARVKSEIYRLAEDADGTQDTYEAIAAGLALVDYHSFLLDRDYKRVRPPNYVKPKRPQFPTEPNGRLLDGTVAYLLIPGHMARSEDPSRKYAADIQSLMREMDDVNNCGWIIDLRLNPGGNMWPMIEAVASLLEPDDTGRLGAWIGSDGEVQEWWGFRDGKIFGEGKEAAPDYVAEDYVVQRPAAPVAILIGEWTASSGEFLAVAFIGRPKTAFFGEDSAGYLTANEDFELSDGATLFLANARATDRHGNSIGNKLEPDFRIDHQSSEISMEEDKTIEAARNWIKEQSECVQN